MKSVKPAFAQHFYVTTSHELLRRPDFATSRLEIQFDGFLRRLEETFTSHPPAIHVNAPTNFNIQQATNVAIGGDIRIQGQPAHQGHREGDDEESSEEEPAERESGDHDWMCHI
ncbi:hypothetical protein PoB_002617700 [Plakobranchus ocellatus]|uniref:Uncharacterized protein n=1 Tax=Plakobranchus ocellatus TaxID=259542 RepID=A0AAV3ZYA9_9GAST|nr:hypothetical protein PoB_002617700 [Plakobranchus ocellatus]